MAALVIAEHDGLALRNATLNTVTAALACAAHVDVLVMGHNCAPVAESAAHISGIRKIILIEADFLAPQLAEAVTEQVLPFAAHYEYFLAPATSFGKNLMPRIAARLDVAQLSDVIRVVSPDTFERPAYAGNAILTVQTRDEKKVVTVRTTKFAPASLDDASASIEKLAAREWHHKSRLVIREETKSERPDLASANVVVSGGRGLATRDNFRKLIEPLADKLGAAVGASRAAVDLGFVPNDCQVGQTGRIVAPALYVAVGISGAVQHLAGMRDSKVIVAINSDPEAPIFNTADYGIVGDLFEVVPELIKALD